VVRGGGGGWGGGHEKPAWIRNSYRMFLDQLGPRKLARYLLNSHCDRSKQRGASQGRGGVLSLIPGACLSEGAPREKRLQVMSGSLGMRGQLAESGFKRWKKGDTRQRQLWIVNDRLHMMRGGRGK